MLTKSIEVLTQTSRGVRDELGSLRKKRDRLSAEFRVVEIQVTQAETQLKDLEAGLKLLQVNEGLVDHAGSDNTRPMMTDAERLDAELQELLK